MSGTVDTLHHSSPALCVSARISKQSAICDMFWIGASRHTPKGILEGAIVSQALGHTIKHTAIFKHRHAY